MINITISQKIKSIAIGLSLLGFSLGIGMIGFSYYCNITWTDSFLNAAMLLTGMGPVHEPDSNQGKVFAGLYALYSGIVFLSIVGIMVVPLFHTYLHKYKLEVRDCKENDNY